MMVFCYQNGIWPLVPKDIIFECLDPEDTWRFMGPKNYV